MPHSEKTYRVHFTHEQERACALRRRLAAGLMSPEDAVPELVTLLFCADYTASVVAAATLGTHGGKDAVLPLVETVLWASADTGSHQDRYFVRQLRCAAVNALKRHTDDATAVNALRAATWDPDPEVAGTAAALVA